MDQYGPGAVSAQLTSAVAAINESDELPFKNILSADRFVQVVAEAVPDFRERVFSPVVTVLAFIAQALCPDGSCRKAVMRVNGDRIAQGRKPASPNTGAYCQAREGLPESLPRDLAKEAAVQLEQATDETWLWKGRHVKLIDGSTLDMSDTSENQAAYPRRPSSAAGVGFPIARIVAIFSLATGALFDLALGPYAGKLTGEHALLRQLLSAFSPGDIALADAYYCSYFCICLLVTAGADVAFRLHGSRNHDFRRGQRLGKHDHVVTWKKPPRPAWMDKDLYDEMPDEITIRELKVSVAVPGFRTKSLLIATTMLCPKRASADDLADLYRRRWHAELDLRTVKITMRMDNLRCKTPSMVRKEIWVHLLAYNLIRKIMAQAAKLKRLLPRDISFKGTVQTLAEYSSVWRHGDVDAQAVYRMMLDAIAAMRVGNRPDRVEPRAKRRRHRCFEHLRRPRAEVREALMHGR